jgi:threonine dehydratase
MEPSEKTLLNTADRIKDFIHQTPVLSSKSINKMTGASIYFKCENFQKMGAFKMRGAANAVNQLTEEEKKQRGYHPLFWQLCPSCCAKCSTSKY